MAKEIKVIEAEEDEDFPDEIRFELSKIRLIIDYLRCYSNEGFDGYRSIEVWGIMRSLEDIQNNLWEIQDSLEEFMDRLKEKKVGVNP